MQWNKGHMRLFCKFSHGWMLRTTTPRDQCRASTGRHKTRCFISTRVWLNFVKRKCLWLLMVVIKICYLSTHRYLRILVRQSEEQTLLCINNYYGEGSECTFTWAFDMTNAKCLLSNYQETDGSVTSHHQVLRPYETRILLDYGQLARSLLLRYI